MSTRALEVPPPDVSPPARTATLARLAGFLLGYTVFVILFGAVVRVTGSGAGCGQHWPTCHGETLHLPRSVETAIELTHRVTSGALMVMVLAVAVLAFRGYPAGHPVRALSAWSVALTVVEALIGAGLVLLALVGQDASVARAVVMPAHLLNTFALTGVMTGLLVFSAPAAPGLARARGALGSPEGDARHDAVRLVLMSGAALLVVSAMGAITALGDTVYPVAPGSLGARLASDHASGAHFLKELRVLHPVLAVLAAAFVAWTAPRIASAAGSNRAHRMALGLRLTLALQLAAGLINVLLSAPGWLQVLHLALALTLFITLVALACELEPGRSSNQGLRYEGERHRDHEQREAAP